MKELVICKDDLKHNINVIKSLVNINKSDVKYKIIAVVKGNGYGLGLIEYSKFLIENGIKNLAVATEEEALELRKSGIKEDILMLTSISLKESIEILIKNDIILTVGSKKCLEELKSISKTVNKKIRVHIKIDTGFGRYGFLYNDIGEIINIINTINLLPNVYIEGMFSHFSLAYYKNNKWTKKQFNRFQNVIEKLEKNNIKINTYHICNSPAYINYPKMRLNAARIGSAFLGRVDCEENLGLKKIGFFRTNIIEIKDVPKGFNIGYLNSYKTKRETKIAIIGCGYMDGYNITQKDDMFRFIDKLRCLFHSIKRFLKKEVLKVTINGKEYNVIGKLGLCHIVIDITGSKVGLNDIVYLDINPLYVDSKIRREYV